MQNNLFDTLKEVLKQDDRFISSDGDLLKNTIRDNAINLDKDLIGLLLDNDILRNKFFIKIKDSLVFDSKNFINFLNNKEFLENSFTRFKNKVGLSDKQGDFLASSNEIVLSWPYKDCILAGGQNKEETKRNEIFYNEILGSDDIDRLLDEKVFTNFKRVNKDGESELKEFKRNKEINKARGLSEDTITDNLLIKGNNLLALHSLKSNFAGKVKLIYIDPPYNTGNDSFNYNDRFNHSTWLTFMKNRLEVAKDLLKDNGVIFVQCDDNEQAYLKVLMDEVFGRDNFVNIISAKMKNVAGASGGGEDKRLKKNIEYISIYTKNYDRFENFNAIYDKTEISEVLNHYKNNNISWKYTAVLIYDGDKEYIGNALDGSGNDIKIYKRNNFIIKSIGLIMKDEKLTLKKVYVKYFNRIFRTTIPQSSIRVRVMEKVKELAIENEFYSIEYVPKSGKNKGQLYEQFYKGDKFNLLAWFSDVAIKEKNNVYKLDKLGTLWDKVDLNNLTKEGDTKFDNGKKPEELLDKIINLSTKKGDIVLDYHLGSGTTCAVAHKMGRQYIGIEQMDYIETISKERLKKVIEGEQGGISKNVEWKGGGDFVYMEIMEENERIIKEIESAGNDKELLEIYNKIKNSEFINFYLNIESIDENINDFKDLKFEDKKRFLIELLDKNLLYKNYSEINDENSGVSGDDKKMNEEFYGK